MARLQFAIRCASWHLLIFMGIAALSATMVFGVWYPMPYRAMLGVSAIYGLVLVTDAVCGPLLTLLLANPSKSRKALGLDFSTIAIIQVFALAYGMHSVWAARPVVLAFERDRLVVVTANQIDPAVLAKAPETLRQLPLFGVTYVGTRRPLDSTEFLQSTELDLAGISPAMRPDWWLPWERTQDEMQRKRKPLADLIGRRPEAADLLRRAAHDAGLRWQDADYLPLTTTKVKDWIMLLDPHMKMAGYAPVDGF